MNAPERVEPLWAGAELVGADGASTSLSSLTPVEAQGLRSADGPGPAGQATDNIGNVRVRPPSRLVYDISGRGFTRFRGSIALDNPRSEIGSTLNPAVRFFVFAAEPNMDRLLPPAAAAAAARGADARDRRGSRRPRVPARARPRALAGRTPPRGERDFRSRPRRTSVRRRPRGPVVGGADEARVPVDLLKDLLCLRH